MKVYVGQTRSRALIERLLVAGWGEMTCRGELPARRKPWAYDNGAYIDWRRARSFQADNFERDVDRMVRDGRAPEFLVLPDIVTGGLASLEFSLAWVDALRGVAPLYLAVQDGMTPDDVRPVLADVDGLFVGGSLRWKLQHGETWCDVGHAAGLPVHVGRVGTFNRVRWARRIGADSIDSCLPLWSEENLTRFVDGLRETAQGGLFEPEPHEWTPPPEFWRGFGVSRRAAPAP